MSAGEGLDEAAKDAADIAAFFKSGKSGRGESGSRRATVALSVWSVVLCHIVAKKDKKNPTDGFHGRDACCASDVLERCAQLIVIYHILVHRLVMPQPLMTTAR